MREQDLEPIFRIIEGAEYLYASKHPAGCQGCRYRVVKLNLLDVPSYTSQVLVEALEGPDAGLLFTTTPHNFAIRYVPAEATR